MSDNLHVMDYNQPKIVQLLNLSTQYQFISTNYQAMLNFVQSVV